MGNSESCVKIKESQHCILFEIDGKMSISRCETALPDVKSVFALLEAKKSTAVALVVRLPQTKDVHAITSHCRKNFPTLFSIVLHDKISKCCRLRLDTFAAGANMLAHDMNDVREALRQVGQQFLQQPSSPLKSHVTAPEVSKGTSAGLPTTTTTTTTTTSPKTYTCPACGLRNLTESALHLHFPLYHSPQPNHRSACPICGQPPTTAPFAVHLHNCHGPPEDREPACPRFAAFAWVLCQRESDGKMMVVHEPAGIAGGRPNYWFPAGRVDAGETLVEAAEREAMEEAGIGIEVTGVIRFMMNQGTPRVLLFARPTDPAAPGKGVPDYESCGAAWLSVKEMKAKLSWEDFRAPDTLDWYEQVAIGALKPMSIRTDAFAALESTIRQLTSTDTLAPEAMYSTLRVAWDKVVRAYPDTTTPMR